MRISKLPTLFLALLACSTAAAQAFDYDDIADGRFRPAQLAGIRPTADGEHYTTIRDGNIFRHRYAVDDAGTALLPAAAEEGAVALDSLDRATGTWCDAGSRRLDIADYAIAPDGGVLVADGAEPIYRHSFTTHYLYYDGRRLREILLGIPSPRDAVFTPDGRNIVFSSCNNLYVYNIERQGTRQITRDGRWNETINGTTDWVYEEEFGFTRAFAVSPDSRRIAYLRFDESRVPLFEMMRYDGALYNRAYDFKYPKAGDANSVVTLHVFDLETGRTTKVDTGADTTQYIPRIGWTPRGELWYETRDRRQQQIVFRRLAAEALTAPQAEQQTIYRERSPRYVAHETDRSFRWIDGGRRFLIMQETATGWMHLYLGEPGEPLRALTEGRWEVTGIVGADDRAVYYTSTERSPLERNLYAVDYKGRHKRLLTPDKGFHTIAPSAGMRYYISTFSSADDPGRVEICDARGRTVRTVADNAALRRLADSIRLPRKEFFTFTTERGDTLNAYIVKPRGFDPSKRYPVLLTQYSGPGSQQVADRWSLDWEDALADKGYIVVCADGRGTGFRGERFKKQTYGRLGALEVEDQLSTARYMASQPWVDPARIGIYGWSYGGFMAASCALKGHGLFRMAIAVAPVTSWRYYDTIYTEIYNNLPQYNAAGYDDNSPINFARMLDDRRTRLLIIHGTADDNVHFQNTVEMTRALNRAGKQYDMMVYPDQNHSMLPDATAHIRQKMIDYTLKNL